MFTSISQAARDSELHSDSTFSLFISFLILYMFFFWLFAAQKQSRDTEGHSSRTKGERGCREEEQEERGDAYQQHFLTPKFFARRMQLGFYVGFPEPYRSLHLSLCQRSLQLVNFWGLTRSGTLKHRSIVRSYKVNSGAKETSYGFGKLTEFSSHWRSFKSDEPRIFFLIITQTSLKRWNREDGNPLSK